MKAWSLSGAAARLDDAFKSLHRAWLDAAQYWDDSASRDFGAKYLDPLEPRVRRALDSMRRIDELLNRAHGALRDDDRGET